MDKGPFNYDLITYAWVLLLSVWGGAVNFMRKLRSGKARPFNFAEFFGEVFTSGFAGLLTFWLCESAHFNQLWTAVLVGVSGHMGSKAIAHLEQWAETKLEKLKG